MFFIKECRPIHPMRNGLWWYFDEMYLQKSLYFRTGFVTDFIVFCVCSLLGLSFVILICYLKVNEPNSWINTQQFGVWVFQATLSMVEWWYSSSRFNIFFGGGEMKWIEPNKIRLIQKCSGFALVSLISLSETN